MKKVFHKLLSIFLAFALVLTLMPAFQLPAKAVSFNRAPTAANTSVVFPTITEDDNSNTGITVSQLLSLAGASDADGNQLSIAVTSVDDSNGTWELEYDKWNQLTRYKGAVSDSDVYLVPNGCSIRFLPAANFSGQAFFTFRVWDETSGTADNRSGDGNVYNASGSNNGGSTGFSQQTITASINVTSVNDAPEIHRTGSGNVLSFISNAYVEVPGDFGISNGPFTVEGWINADRVTKFGRFFDFGKDANTDGDSGGHNILADFRGGDDQFAFEIWNGKDRNSSPYPYAAIATTDTFPLNKWVYVSAVYDETHQIAYFYWNGKLTASKNVPSTTEALARTCNYFGKSLWTNDEYFSGKMRGISVWKEARTASEVASDMNTGFSGNENNLVLYYPLNEDPGTHPTSIASATNSFSGNLMSSGGSNNNMVTNDSSFDYQVTGFVNQNIPVDQMYIKDVDAGAAGVSLTLSAGSGTLAVINPTDGVGITGNKTGSLTLTGTVDDINRALRTLTYNSASTCSDTISANVTDNGHSGNGGPLTDAQSIGVTVSAVPAGTPSISVQPLVSQTVKLSETAQFSVTASAGSDALTYQWQKSADGGTTWADISGETSISYTTPPTTKTDNGTQYRCYVYDTTNNMSVMSDKATLTVTYPILKMANASPANGATGVPVNTSLSLTFNENVTAVQGKYIHIVDALNNDTTIDAGSANVIVSGNTVTVTPPNNLNYTTKYHVLIDSGAFKDDNQSDYGGLSDGSWSFMTTATPDTTAPTLTSTTPSNGALSVSPSTQLTMNFSEPVKAVSGNITVYTASDDSVVQKIAVTDSCVAVNDNTVTVTLPSGLNGSTKYYIKIDSGAFTDNAGNIYTGISDNTAWSFTTSSSSDVAPGLSLGSATGTGPYYYSNATVTGSGIKTILLSFAASVASGDTITLPTGTDVPTGFVVSGTSNNYTKRINIDGAGADAATVQKYIRGIGFTLGGTSQSVKVTITTVNVQYDTFYDVDTQHYYQYIPYTAESTDTQWTDAYNSAKQMTYLGRTGYLATITSLAEDTLLNKLSGGKVGWLGGTALIHNGADGSLYYSGFDTSANSGNIWYWADGPERGTTFYTGRNNTRNSQDGTYPYWNWGGGEPNGTTATDGENCLTTLVRNDTGGSHGTSFSWNDVIYNYSSYKQFGDFSPLGYFVEFGNMSPGSNETVDTRFASVTGSLSSGASAYAASITGQTVVGQTLTANLSGGTGTASAYKWMRGDSVIAGATASTYTLTSSDIGSYISVKITTSDNATASSPQVGPVVAKPTLVATADNSNNCVDLHWTAGGDHYMVYRTDSSDITNAVYQSVPVSTNIKVLNVYPDDNTGKALTAVVNGITHTSADLKTWMDTYGSPTTANGVHYNMTLTQVPLSTFKSNPGQYLGTVGNYNYDVVFFGSWDCNGGNTVTGDLDTASEAAIKQFINNGGGCLAGHDTSLYNGGTSYYHPKFNDLMSLFNITMSQDTGYGQSDQNCQISVAKNGLLTNYPYKLGSVLTVPGCHTNGQHANGDIWMRFSGNAEAANFYLTTWNNTAMIQTGHSNDQATEDEQKIITNTLYYLAQVTKQDSATDHMAQDLAAPNAVDGVTPQSAANRTTLTWNTPSDNGSTYNYYVREFSSADNTSHVDSAKESATVTTGVKGYYVLVDQNPTDNATTVKTANHFVTTNSFSSFGLTGTNYAHIITVDNAGNESAVADKQFTVAAVSPVAGSGNALSFDGIDDYVNVPSNSAYTTTNFTVEAWVQYSSNQSYSGIVDKGRNTGKNWYILSGDGTNRGVVAGMQGASELSYNWPDNNWHHVCITCNNSTFLLYVDGIQRGSTTVNGYAPVDSVISFGRRTQLDSSGGHLSYYTGNLDEVKLWDTARTQDQIQSDMYSHSVSDSDLVGYWSFDEGFGTTTTDLTNTHNNGTLNGMDSSAWIASQAWQNRATTEDTPLVIDAGYTWDSNAVTLAGSTNPTNGKLSFDNSDKTVTYTPNTGYSGTDKFTYTMTENGITKSYSVNITVVQNPVMTGPSDVTAAEGSKADLTVAVSTPPSGVLTYQWQKFDGGNWKDINGATGSTYEITSAASSEAGQYRCVVTNTNGITKAVTTSSAATLTVTFKATVTINKNDSASIDPVMGGTVELKQGGVTKAALTSSGSDGVYTANVVNGDYDIYVNGENVGQKITIRDAAKGATVDYYSVSFAVSDGGVASGCTVSATADGADITSGAIVLKGKTVVLTANGKGAGDGAYTSYYSYAWSGSGVTGSPTSQSITVNPLGSKVDATCTVTGRATYSVTLNANGGSINSGAINSYAYGTGATLPTQVTKGGYVFGGWYASSDFSGNAVTSISTSDKGEKTFYAKWVQIPVISTQPVSQIIPATNKVDFTVAVAEPATGITYQWQKSTDGSNWTDISNATNTTYTIGSVTKDDAGQYRCVVTNGSITATATSNAATLTVTFLATVNVKLDGVASNAPVGTDGTVKLEQNNTVIATLTKISDGVYTVNVANGVYDVYINGENVSQQITINNGIDGTGSATVNYYSVTFGVTNEGAASGSTVSATANSAAITSGAAVLAGKKIELTANGAGVGTDASTSSYTYVWSGDGVTGTPTTQSITISSLGSKVNAACAVMGSAAYSVTLDTNGGTINSGNFSSYTYGIGATLPTNVTKNGYVFGGWYASSNFSASAVTSISNTDKGAKTFYAKWVQIPVIGTQPDSQTIPAGTQVSFSVAVSAPESGLSYKWQKSTDGSSWTDITNATNTTYTIGSVTKDDAGQYRCIVTNAEGDTTATATSNAATLTVTFSATVNLILDSSPSDKPFGSGVVLKRNGGSDVTLTRSSTGVYAANATNGVYDVYVNGENIGQQITINNSTGSATVNYYSVTFTATNADAASGSTISAMANSATITSGSVVLAGKKIVLTANGEGAGTDASTSSYTYVWSGGGVTGTPSTQSITIDSLGSTVNATCAVTGSATYSVTLYPNSGTIANGKGVTSYAYGTGTSLPTGSDITYPGYVFGGWFDNVGLTGSAVTAISATDKGAKTFYAKWVQNPVISTQPVSQTIPAGSPMSFSVVVSIPTSGLSYRWQNSTDGGNTWTDIESATGATYTINSVAASDAGQYRCVVTNKDGSATAVTTSDAATLTVTFKATVTVNLDDKASDIPVGIGVLLKHSGSSDVTLTKQSNTGVYAANAANGTYNVYVNGADTGKTVAINNDANSALVNYYSVTFATTDAGAAYGSTVTATVDSVKISSGTAVLSGKKIELTATGEGVGTDAKTSSYAYLWTGVTGTSTEQYTIIDSLSSKTDITCTVTGSATYSVALYPNSGTIANGKDLKTYAYGTGASLPTGSDITYPGYVFGGWYPTNSDFSGNAVVAVSTIDKGAKTFYAKWVQNPVISTQPISQTISDESSVTFSVGVTAPPSGILSYQWQKSVDGGKTWLDIDRATDAAYTISNVKSGDAGQYQCVVTNTDGTTKAVTTSSAAALTVTFTATVNIKLDNTASDAPVGVGGNVKLEQNNTEKTTLSSSATGVYTANVVNGDYDVYVNGENIGQKITINNAAKSATVDYYTVTFAASDAGAASGSKVTAKAGGADVATGAIVLKGQTVVFEAIGEGANYYSYFWLGTGTNGQDTNSLTITSLSGTVNATCTVTGRTNATTYSVSLDTNGGSISSGSITSYTFGVGATLPTDVKRDGYVFDGWYVNPDFSGNAVTEIGTSEMGNKVFYAKWRLFTIGGTVVDDHNDPLNNASVTIRGNNITQQTETTGLDGKYSFSGIPKGEYNIIAFFKGVTTTVIIKVTDKDIKDETIMMPSAGKENSLVTIDSGTPDVVVGNLEKQFTSDDDTYVGTKGNTINIELEVNKKSEDSAKTDGSAAKIQSVTSGQSVDMYLDMTLTKTVTGTHPAPPATLKETPTDTLLKIIIPYDMTGKSNIKVYRVHEGVAEAMTEKPYSTDVQTSECFMTDVADKQIVVWAQKFSTYAIAYSVPISGGNSGSGSQTASGLPYYIDNSGNKVFIGFSSDKSGEMKYIAPKGEAVLFTPNPKNFTDISGHWAKSYIDFVTQREIFIGTDSNVFSPDTGMTRAMFATVIGRLYERSYGALKTSGPHAFTDCNYDSWYGTYIDWCSENGIIEGVGGGLYEPDREISRQEMASILYRFATFMGVSAKEYENTQLTYPDTSSISSWATNAAKYCQQTGIIEGRDGGNFVPQGTATRAEVSAILERFIEKMV